MAIAGLQGDFQAQPRVFAHDGLGLTAAQIASGTYTIPNTSTRGVCLFVGVKMASITVTMESGSSVVFKGVAAGAFMPVLVTSVTAATPDGGGALADNDIVALY
jgi:hypothetical protein